MPPSLYSLGGENMSETIKETVTTKDTNSSTSVDAPVETKASSSQTIGYLIYFLFGVLEVLLVFRLVLKLTGANPGSAFVGFIYSLSELFIQPFTGIFHSAVGQGVETTALFEPATLVAIVVYAVFAWGIAQLVIILSGKAQS